MVDPKDNAELPQKDVNESAQEQQIDADAEKAANEADTTDTSEG